MGTVLLAYVGERETTTSDAEGAFEENPTRR
jgi:hypothetical protein